MFCFCMKVISWKRFSQMDFNSNINADIEPQSCSEYIFCIFMNGMVSICTSLPCIHHGNMVYKHRNNLKQLCVDYSVLVLIFLFFLTSCDVTCASKTNINAYHMTTSFCYLLLWTGSCKSSSAGSAQRKFEFLLTEICLLALVIQ